MPNLSDEWSLMQALSHFWNETEISYLIRDLAAPPHFAPREVHVAHADISLLHLKSFPRDPAHTHRPPPPAPPPPPTLGTRLLPPGSSFILVHSEMRSKKKDSNKRVPKASRGEKHWPPPGKE